MALGVKAMVTALVEDESWQGNLDDSERALLVRFALAYLRLVRRRKGTAALGVAMLRLLEAFRAFNRFDVQVQTPD